MEYTFIWDPTKARQNQKKHGVSFAQAAQIFLDPMAISIYDEEHSSEDDRWITMGMDKNDILLVVVHTIKK